jgi:A/G-specific adenine glycosylase
VLSRLCAVIGRKGEHTRDARIWSIAEARVPRRRPGDWNQALMELGATVCRAENPLCLVCPVVDLCQARRLGVLDQCPTPSKIARRKELHFSVAVWRRSGRLLLARRPERGLFGGLWEMPVAEVKPSSIRAAETALQHRLGPSLRVIRSLGSVHRSLTHRELTLHLFQVSAPKAPRSIQDYVEVTWVTPREAAKLGVSTAMAKAMALGAGAQALARL